MNSFTLDFDDYSLDFLRQGSGQPLLLIHGSVSDARTWRQHIDILSQHFDVIAPSLRYFGQQPWPDDGSEFGSAIHAADILRLVDQLSLKDTLCAGWSYGGNVALHSAVLNSPVFKRIFLYEPAVGSLLKDDAARELATADRKAMFAQTAARLHSVEQSELVESFLDDAVGKKGAFQSMPENVKRVGGENASMLKLLFNMTPAPINLDEFKVPTVLACGADTRDFYKITANGLGQQCASINVKYIPGANHIWPVVDVDGFCSMLTESVDVGQ